MKTVKKLEEVLIKEQSKFKESTLSSVINKMPFLAANKTDKYSFPLMDTIGRNLNENFKHQNNPTL